MPDIGFTAAFHYVSKTSGKFFLVENKNIVDCFVVTIEGREGDFRVFCQSAGVQAGEVGFTAVDPEER